MRKEWLKEKGMVKGELGTYLFWRMEVGNAVLDNWSEVNAKF